MDRKKILGSIGLLAIAAAASMYYMGRNSSNLSELKDIWWTPLPFAAVCFLTAGTGQKK